VVKKTELDECVACLLASLLRVLLVSHSLNALVIIYYTEQFHEFGHGLQHMLTTATVGDVSGINGVEWDAVELPSQFMENWYVVKRKTIIGTSTCVAACTGNFSLDDSPNALVVTKQVL
jgi:hypothetical protein